MKICRLARYSFCTACVKTALRFIPFSDRIFRENNTWGKRALGIEIEGGYKERDRGARGPHVDSARRVKVNLSQLVRGFPERSICLRRYIQEMKFLGRRALEKRLS